MDFEIGNNYSTLKVFEEEVEKIQSMSDAEKA